MAADYYQTLGVKRGASEAEIKRAYRRKAHEYHPDKGEGDEVKFKEINQAYQVLSDPEKRRNYDQFGQTSQDSGFGGQGSEGFDFSGFDFSGMGGQGGFSDLFETFFGGGARRGASLRGQDLEVQMVVEFEEAVFGASKKLTLNIPSVCDRCQGSGAEPGSKLKECDRCGGSGQEERIQRTVLGSIRTATVCSKCRGRGEMPEKECRICRGERRLRKRREIMVGVPPGVDSGQTIRVRGQGEAGPAGAEPGDLYVFISV